MSITESPEPAAQRRRLRAPFAAGFERVSWRELAACRTADPELFFPIGRTGPAIGEIERAKAVCASCPVRERCLTFALDTRQDYGIWGGYDDEERRLLHRQRQAGPWSGGGEEPHSTIGGQAAG
jgi:WhiB family transcriptional regulator, redox-sensing transcriptional regulator